MKLLHFDDFKLGVLKGSTVVDVSEIANEVPHIGAHDRINGLIESFDKYRDRLEAAAASGDGRLTPFSSRPIVSSVTATQWSCRISQRQFLRAKRK